MGASLKIFVSAGEASSDLHCAGLVRELRKCLAPAAFEVFGLGGDALAAEGARLLMHNREFSVGGGPIEVVGLIPKRRKLELIVERELFDSRVSRPSGAIVVDNGEINLRLAALLHYFGVPVVYFIPPKVWVWRHSRIEKIAQHVKLVLGILPFEEPMYKEWEIPFQYVGNPLLDEVPSGLSSAEAKRRLGVEPDRDVLAVLPGSRHNEVRYQARLFAEGVARFFREMPAGSARPLVLIPVAPAIDPAAVEGAFSGPIAAAGSRVRVVKGMSHECLAAARVALVKSGTSTLEAALLGTPMVLAYHSSRSSELFYRHVVRYRGFVGLVNLFLARSADAALGWAPPEESVVPELILGKCTAENIARELARLWPEGAARERMRTELARTRALLAPPPELGASSLVAAANAAARALS